MSKNKFPLPVYKTPIAERKIIEIAQWSVKKWGKKTAREYLANLEKRGCKNNCVNAHCGGLSQQW